MLFLLLSLGIVETIPEVAAIERKADAVRGNPADYRWQSIPWIVDEQAAIKQAKQENRAMLVWLAGGRERDGSPLERC